MFEWDDHKILVPLQIYHGRAHAVLSHRVQRPNVPISNFVDAICLKHALPQRPQYASSWLWAKESETLNSAIRSETAH